jgi:hypothetical protein
VICIDPLEYDVKRALATSPNNQLQWHKIRNELYEKYEKEYGDKNSFTTILQRRLQKLRNSGDIDKKEAGHQEVFYFIPKKRLMKIKEALDREAARQAFDEIWDSFTPEQRKRELQNLLKQWQLGVMMTRNQVQELISPLEELIELYVAQLENPTEETKAKHSPAERERFLRELQQLEGEAEKIKTDIAHDKQQVITQEELKAKLNLIHEFSALVVEPRYSGKWNEAVMDLMREAIEEQKQKKE